MSFNRLSYDNCAYSTTIKESVSSLDYNLFKGKYENTTNCKVSDFSNVLQFGPRADVENELYNLTRPNSHCPGQKYNPAREFKNPDYSPPHMCENIYYITPTNLVKPTTNYLNEKNLGITH
jgi:hypothetical protein